MMNITEKGLALTVADGADHALAVKVCQFLANSINGPVVAQCRFGEVIVTPGRAATVDEFRAASQFPDERAPAAAIESLTKAPEDETPPAPRRGKK